MTAQDAAWVTAAASGLTAGAAIIGIPLIYRQVRHANAAAQLAAKVARSQLYGTVAGGMDRLNQFLALHPDLLGYLYEGREVPADADPNTSGWIELMCEEFMDFMDGLIEQRRSLPDGMDWSTWDAYFRSCYKSSPALRNYVEENLAFYPDYTLSTLGYLIVRAPKDGHVVGTWIANEVGDNDERLVTPFGIDMKALPRRGYPWVRSWAFSRFIGLENENEADPEILMSVEQDGRKATVTTRVKGEADEDVLSILRSWIVDGMRGVSIDTVEFRNGKKLQRYDMRKLGLAGERVFENPRFPAAS